MICQYFFFYYLKTEHWSYCCWTLCTSCIDHCVLIRKITDLKTKLSLSIKQSVDYRTDSNGNSIHRPTLVSNHQTFLSTQLEQCVLDVSHRLQTSLMITLDMLHWEVRGQRSTSQTGGGERMCKCGHWGRSSKEVDIEIKVTSSCNM